MVNVKPVKMGSTTRMSFGKIDEVIDMPNLIEIQKKSYEWFLDEGLKEVFRDVSGISDHSGNLVLDFVDYFLDIAHPKHSVIECKERDATYAAPLKVTARLTNREADITALTFISNEKNIYTDADTIGQISEILKREPSENAFESKGYRGKIEATSSGGKVTQYIVYSDHLTKEGTQSVTIALTENDLTLLTQLFS